MLSNIEIDKNTSTDQLVEYFNKAWKESKVIHIKGQEFSNPDEMREFYDALMESAGEPGDVGEDATVDARESDAQRTGQRWTEIRYDPSIPDAYRHSANAQPLHTDGSYVPNFPDAAIIYCQASANDGGETVFLDSEDLLAIMQDEAPELLEKLKLNMMVHSRSGTRKDVKVVDEDEEGVRLAWNYYCVAKDIPSEVEMLKEEFHHFLKNSARVNERLVEVGLKPGECVIWKDYRVLHGRNSFNPKNKSERFLWKSAFSTDT